jgi:small-conductance mechanosensitive channel
MYRVGDRIKVNNFNGDVIDVGYFYTTLWEFGGEYISNDLPSGRIIMLPNSLIFTTSIYNYSWPLFPYIWTEVEFYISYDSDFEFVEEQVTQIAKSKVGSEMKQNVARYRKVLATTPVDDVEVKDDPRVFFEANSSTWIKTTVRFLGNPKEIAQIKKELLLEIIKTLSESPEKVGFPNGNAR